MAPEAGIIHHIAWLIAHQSGFGEITKFIQDKTGKERLSRHI